MGLQQKFQQIIDLQNEFNKVINPEWKNAGYNFDTAILVEAVELIDSFHWAWWKDGVDNLANAKVEVVDILHFLLSDWMITRGSSFIDQLHLAAELANSANSSTWVIYGNIDNKVGKKGVLLARRDGSVFIRTLYEQIIMKIFEKDKFIKGISDIILIVGYSEQFIYIYTKLKKKSL